MASASFRVVIARFDEDRRNELVDELSAELDISKTEASELLRTLPLTVARGLTEDDAEDLADLLEEQGAKVRIVEVSDRRGRAGRRRPTPTREPEAADDEDDEAEDEDEEEADDDEEDADRPRPRAGARPSSRVVLLVGGIVVVVLVAVIVVMAVTGVDFGMLSCGGGFRGPGANVQLSQALATQLAPRFAQGFQPDDAVAHGTLANKQVATLRERLQGPACYIWIGFSQQGSDLDLHLSRNGSQVTEDRGEDNYPVVRHCVDETSVYELDVEMYAGTSDWVVQRYVLQGAAGSQNLEQLHQHYESTIVRGAEPVTELRRVKQLSPGQDRSIPVELEAQWCYLVLAVSQPGTDLDASIENPRGLKIAEDSAVDNYPILRDVCPSETGEHRLHLIMYTGSSEVVYRIYRGKMGGAASPAGQPQQPRPLDTGAATPTADGGAQPQPAGEPAQPPAGQGGAPAAPTQP